MEAETTIPPAAGYLEAVKRLCEEHGIVLIFDENDYEIPLASGGAQKFHGVIPHLSTLKGHGKWVCDFRFGGKARTHAAR